MEKNHKNQMYAIELTEIPRSYFEHAMKHPEKKASSPTHVKFERFLSSLSHTDVPTEREKPSTVQRMQWQLEDKGLLKKK